MELVVNDQEVSGASILNVGPAQSHASVNSPLADSYLAAHGLIGTNLDAGDYATLACSVVVGMHEIALTLDEKVHAIMQERAFLQERCDSLEASITRSQLELRNFKGEVRRVAIDVAEEQNWCKSGLNERLEELGLDPVPYTFNIDASITVNFQIEEATDEDDAREQARDVLNDWLSDASDSYFDSITATEQEG